MSNVDIQTPTDIRARYEAALDFPGYLETVVKNRDLWQGVYRRASVPAELADAVGSIQGRFHLLALSEDWCGDAVNTLPVVARLVEAAPGLDMRVVGRDDNPDLMDTHLTNGRSRSIPVVIVYDENFDEVAWWGPRPGELQAWVLGPEGQALDSGDRYREARRWYVKDRGHTTVSELLELLEQGGLTSES